MGSNKTVTDVRNYFSQEYGHIHLDQLPDNFILEFMSEPWIQKFSFEKQMDFLYDHILAQDLCDVTE